MEQKTFKKVALFAGLIVGLWALYRFTRIYDYLTLEFIKEQSLRFKELVDQYYVLSALVYIAFFITTVALSIPASILLTILGGYLFGVVHATIFSTVSVTVGVSIAFLVYRFLLQDTLRQTYAERAKRFEKAMKEYGVSYLLVLHFSTIFPYFVINAVAALSHLPFYMVILATAVGFFPQGIIYAFAGKELASIEKVSDIFSTNVIIALALLILLALIPIIIKKFKKAEL